MVCAFLALHMSMTALLQVVQCSEYQTLALFHVQMPWKNELIIEWLRNVILM